MTESEEHLDQLHDCTFYVQRCIRYHMHRSAFFARWNRITSFVGVVFGSAALASLMMKADVQLTSIAALIVTIISAIDLVAGTSSRAWEHRDLRRRFIAVEVQLLAADITRDDLIRLRREIRSIEADEPPGLALLNEIAANEVIRATYPGDIARKHVCALPWLKRVTANLIDWDVGVHIDKHASKDQSVTAPQST